MTSITASTGLSCGLRLDIKEILSPAGTPQSDYPRTDIDSQNRLPISAPHGHTPPTLELEHLPIGYRPTGFNPGVMSEHQDLRSLRLDKLARLRELGMDPFRVERFPRSHTAKQLLSDEVFAKLAPEETPVESRERVQFAGRVVSYRLMGKAAFAHLSDGDAKVQGYFRKDDLSAEEWEAFGLLDLGDHVGVSGELFVTKTGERSVYVRSFQPLSKALVSVPLGKEKDGERYSELSDVEQRYRHRHLDLLANPEARKMLLDRARIISSVRRYFDGQGFLEVETPLLQLEAGGAAARPFKTHYNAYDLEVKLRISLELYLKRIICGDVPKVYEVGRVFRNEGVSNRHNPEFTLLEWYEAYVDLDDTMIRVEECFRHVAIEVFGSPLVEVDGVTLDFGRPWARLDLITVLCERTGLQPADFGTLERLKAALGRDVVRNESNGKVIVLAKEHKLGGLIEKLLEVFVEDTLVEPTFVTGYPIEISPLAKKDPEREGYVRRFEAYIRGKEVANAFSEINDPLDQRSRFEAQVQERAGGDEEAHPMDEEFLYALECGMPPTGGCGIGLDRMAMMLTGADTIREVLLFPMMKPEEATVQD